TRRRLKRLFLGSQVIRSQEATYAGAVDLPLECSSSSRSAGRSFRAGAASGGRQASECHVRQVRGGPAAARQSGRGLVLHQPELASVCPARGVLLLVRRWYPP